MRGVLDRFLQNDPLERLGYSYTKAALLQDLDRLDEADAIFAAGMREGEQMAGRASRWFRTGVQHRAAIAAARGNLPQAEAFFDMAGDNAKTGHGSSGRAYGEYLVMVGRAADAVELLQTDLANEREFSQDEDDERTTEVALGEALDQSGHVTQARVMLQAARDGYMQWGVPSASDTLMARVHWARFLMDHGDPAAARDEFLAVTGASDTASAPRALAWAGLARLSLAAGGLVAAQKLSTQALGALDGIRVAYDPRAKVDVWLARSEVLRAAGRRAEALDLARQAAAAADTHDSPVARQRLLAHRLAAQIER
jgi:tetratricopeptide (TPR) repeat protein